MSFEKYKIVDENNFAEVLTKIFFVTNDKLVPYLLDYYNFDPEIMNIMVLLKPMLSSAREIWDEVK